jgi:hypothetical protein
MLSLTLIYRTRQARLSQCTIRRLVPCGRADTSAFTLRSYLPGNPEVLIFARCCFDRAGFPFVFEAPAIVTPRGS